jgi:hypothetical protein
MKMARTTKAEPSRQYVPGMGATIKPMFLPALFLKTGNKGPCLGRVIPAKGVYLVFEGF